MIIFNRTSKNNCLIFDKNRSKVDGGLHVYLKEIIKLPDGSKKYKYEISFAIDSESFIKSTAHRIIVTPIPPGLGGRKQLKIQETVGKLNSGLGLLSDGDKILKKSGKNRLIKASTLDEINLTEHASWITDIPQVANLLWKGCNSSEVLIEAMSHTGYETTKPENEAEASWSTQIRMINPENPGLSSAIVKTTQDFKKAIAVGANPDNIIDETKPSYVLKTVDEINKNASKDSLHNQEAAIGPQFDGGDQKKETNTVESMVAQKTHFTLSTDEIFEASTRYRTAVDILEGNMGEKTSAAQDTDNVSVVWSDEENFEDSVIETVGENTTETNQPYEILFEALEAAESVSFSSGFAESEVY